jgi:hypothetical protein
MVPSCIVMLEGNMRWLENTPSHAKREGFFIANKEVEGFLYRSISTLFSKREA